MTIYSDIWRLPGPGGFVRDVARAAVAGQHVVAVCPRFISDDPEYSDALSVAILAELESARRVYPSSLNGMLTSALGFEMTDGFGESPSTMPSLISHPDVVGSTFLCNSIDLDAPHREELSAFLERLNDESRPVPTSERGTMIFVVGRSAVSHDPASVAMAPIWYWDRVARWDVAALIAMHQSAALPAGVEGEVRLETIIEVSRWDLQLAIELAQEWAGGEPDVSTWVERTRAVDAPPSAPRRTVLKRPPESHLGLWDEGLVESWHGSPEIAPILNLGREKGIDSIIWRAQARVLLPWLEVRRVAIERRVRDRLGAQRMEAAIDEFSYRFPGADIDLSIVELSTLTRIVGARIGRTDERLRDTARSLLLARNKLAHLTALTGDELEHLIREVSWLT